jgi:nucleotidyltransferase substrate binding protein (TIGR01987 family)
MNMINKDIRWQQRFSNYNKALTQLSDAVELAQERDLSELEQQGLVQAFEFTHELAWKTLKDFLEYRGNRDIYGSKDATRAAFQLGLLENGETWMDMIQSRNQTSHTYNEETVKEIVAAIEGDYFAEFKKLQATLTELKEEEQNEP